MPKSIKYSIPPQSLRYGNNVYNRKKRVVFVFPDMIQTLLEWGTSKYSKFPPFRGIPLDEKNILKISFELQNNLNKSYSEYELTTGDLTFVIFHENILSKGFKLYEKCDNTYNYLKDVVFIHDVQNMVYELSGNMLSIMK